jgi:hypothetical protein
MNKRYYLFVDNNKLGPYSIEEIKNSKGLPENALIMEEGTNEWLAFSDVLNAEKANVHQNSNIEYYVLSKKQKQGPFSFDELINYGIERKTLIWKKGLKTWIVANSLDDFTQYFQDVPPPAPSSFDFIDEVKNIFGSLTNSVPKNEIPNNSSNNEKKEKNIQEQKTTETMNTSNPLLGKGSFLWKHPYIILIALYLIYIIAIKIRCEVIGDADLAKSAAKATSECANGFMADIAEHISEEAKFNTIIIGCAITEPSTRKFATRLDKLDKSNSILGSIDASSLLDTYFSELKSLDKDTYDLVKGNFDTFIEKSKEKSKKKGK